MSRSNPPFGRVALAGVILVLTSTVVAMPALAARVSVGCAGLQNALTNAGTGDVITLTRMCTGKSFTLPSRRITLRGARGAGFDGTGAPSQLLKGTDVGNTVIRDLIFRDARGPWDGNAIIIDGTNSAPRILNSTFINNGISNGYGGSIMIIQGDAATGPVVVANNRFGGAKASQGNDASFGAAAYLITEHEARITGNVFRNNNSANHGGAIYWTARGPLQLANNRFIDNSAQLDGGGAYIYPTDSVALTRNIFDGNRLVGGTSPPAFRRGGGLFLFLDTGSGLREVRQQGNVFSGNRIAASSSGSMGGGQFIMNIGAGTIVSRDDRYIRNRLDADGRGGGLALGTANLSGDLHVDLLNTVVAGNSTAGAGMGGGLYNDLNCISTCSMDIELTNGTVAGNKIASGTGVQSYVQAPLIAKNSIIFGSGSANDNVAVGAVTISSSDVCAAGTAPAPGPGNICKNPRLRQPGAGDVHQTRRSPTRDKGSNASVPSGLRSDYEGHRRVLDSNNDGTKRVDMGADEMRKKARISIRIRTTVGRIAVSGAVAPNNRGKRVLVTLSRNDGSGFRRLGRKSDRLNRRSRYAVTFGRPSPGTCRALVEFAGSPSTLPGRAVKKFPC